MGSVDGPSQKNRTTPTTMRAKSTIHRLAVTLVSSADYFFRLRRLINDPGTS